MNPSSVKAAHESCVLAMDAGGTGIKTGLVVSKNGGITVLSFRETPVPSDGSAEEIEKAFAEAARKGAEDADSLRLSLAGVGVSIPGPFDYPNGINHMTHKYAALRGRSLRPCIEEAAGGFPVKFMHDSSAFFLGELADGHWKEYRRICGVTIGTGLGFAAVKDGELLVNPEGGPGISIFRTPFRGETAEEFVSKRGILKAYKALGGTGEPSVKEIDIAARSGDPLCASVFHETGRALAEITAPIIKRHGFECMLVGGQIAKAGDLLTLPAEKRLEELGVLCAVKTARRIIDAPLVGAAQLFLGGT